MKKTIHDIFDEATSSEMDHLISKSDAPDVSKKTRARIKDKAYAKAGLAAPQKKNSVEVIGRYVAAAACLCMMIGVVLFAVSIFGFDGVSPTKNTEQDKVLSQGGVADSGEDNKQNNDANGNTPGHTQNDTGGMTENNGSSDGNVQSTLISEQGELVMTIVKTRPSCPAFEKNCFYAKDESGRVCRVIWSEFEGLSEEDRIVVQYRDLKELTYKEYSSGWTPPYELTAVSVQLLEDVPPTVEKNLPKLTMKCYAIRVCAGDTFNIWNYILEADNYTHISFESSMPSSISVDQTGKVTVHDAECATIKISAINDDGMKTASISIYGVNYGPEIILFEEKAKITIGETYELFEMLFTLANEIIYESDDPSIATVDKNGKILGVGVGNTTIRIYGVVGESLSSEVTFDVTVREPWAPTDPISREVVAAKDSLACFETFDWYLVNISKSPQYNIREDDSTTGGPVEIWYDTLQMSLRFNQSEVDYSIAVVDNNLYFDVYYRPYDETNDRGDYKKATLQPWSVYTAGNPIYRCTFYRAFFVENDGLVEDQLYEVVIVVREGENQLGYVESEFTWTDSCAIFTEYAESDPTIIK